MRQPWENQKAGAGPRSDPRPEIRGAALLLRFFQRVVSPVDGPRCNLVPTCSEFSRQAIQRFGLVPGILLTAGRLMRDNASAHHFYRQKRIDGTLVLYDPPEDHWPLSGKGRKP